MRPQGAPHQTPKGLPRSSISTPWRDATHNPGAVSGPAVGSWSEQEGAECMVAFRALPPPSYLGGRQEPH